MTEPSTDISAYLDALLDAGRSEANTGVEAIRARAEEIRATFASLEARTYVGHAGEAADDERVTATVSSNGVLTHVEINPYGMRDLDRTALALACTQAIADARVRAMADLEATIAELRGDSPSAPTPPDIDDIDRLFGQAKEYASQWNDRTYRR